MNAEHDPASAAQRCSGLQHSIALIGYGEVGQRFAADLHQAGLRDITAWDRLFDAPDSPPSRSAARANHICVAHGMAAAVKDRSLIISAVTADECVAAAREAAATIAPGARYLDLNSVAPETTLAAAQAFEASGACYIEAAIMAPIAPKGLASPVWVGGPHAEAFVPQARALGLTGLEFFDAVLGKASAAKMCRSVMIKGLEALLAESLLAARYHGVEASVLASLCDLLPCDDWDATARYMISRSLLHGRRRSEEMREAAKAVADAGLDPWMSTACAQRQAWAAKHGESLPHESLVSLLDAVLGEMHRKPHTREQA